MDKAMITGGRGAFYCLAAPLVSRTASPQKAPQRAARELPEKRRYEKNMRKKRKKRFFMTLLLAGVLLCGAGTLSAQQTKTLDEVIALAGKDIAGKIESEFILAVLHLDSDSEMFSRYVIEELAAVLVNEKVSVIDRQNLDLVRAEVELRLSGDVDDNKAASLGKQLGAQGIVTGSLQDTGATFRFRIKVINVESAQIEAQFGCDLRKDERTMGFFINDPNDAEEKQSWVRRLQENEAELVRELIENPAFEPAYTLKKGVTSGAETMTLLFDAKIASREKMENVYRSVEERVKNVQEQLAATGRAAAWGLGSWPEKSAAGGVSPFASGGTQYLTVEVELLNDKGRVIGRQGFSLPWGWVASFTKKGMSLNSDTKLMTSVAVEFDAVPVYELTDTLTVNTVKINGTDAADRIEPYLCDWAEWAEGQRKRQEGFDIFKALLPHQAAAGGMFTNPVIGTVSLYNTVPFLSVDLFEGYKWYDALFGSNGFDESLFTVDYGCDFGFLLEDIGNGAGLRCYSFYPNIHLRGFLPIITKREGRSIKEEYGPYMGWGFGVMFTTYGGKQAATPAFDFKAGIKVWRLDIAYSLALNLDSKDPVFIGGGGLIHKLTVKLLIPY